MNDLLLFVTGPLPGSALPARYDSGLVALSYIVASLAAYTAIDLAGRVSEFRTEPRRAAAWLTGGAFAMGAGIWSMRLRLLRCNELQGFPYSKAVPLQQIEAMLASQEEALAGSNGGQGAPLPGGRRYASPRS